MNTYFASLHGKEKISAELDHDKVLDDVHHSGGEIIRLKGATYYAIAVSATRICKNILRDANSVMPLSGMLHGEYGFEGLCMSLPFILNREGIVASIAPPLTNSEMESLRTSADLLKDTIAKVNI